MTVLRARCCVAGGGPAGMMLGYLLARAGVETLVLEKHADFLRDFRGDTVHPSTLEVVHELGLLERFLERPHQKVYELAVQINGETAMVADFRRLPARCRFIAFMPQWDFLDFLSDEARRLPAFALRMHAEALDLVVEDGRVAGVRGRGPEGAFEARAELTVAADGRHSVLRERAGLALQDFGAPMDVLWMKLSKRPADPAAVLGRINAGRVFVTLDRGEYWQCAYVIAKGGYDEVRAAGLPALREGIAEVAPFLAERTRELRDWNDVKLLAVQVNRLRRWYRDGLLCIGDAAHAMSPVGGVGINLAIQDAVAAANILAPRMTAGRATPEDLAAVQRRRDWPARVTQQMQLAVQRRVIGRVLAGRGPSSLPWAVRMLQRFPRLRGIPARLVGMGIRPEHVRTRAAGI